MKTSLLSFALVLFAVAPQSVQRLEVDHQRFIEDFRASDGRVRLVTILSPT